MTSLGVEKKIFQYDNTGAVLMPSYAVLMPSIFSAR